MKHIYSVLSLLILGATLSIASAQAVSLPYQMSFETADSIELQNWTLNPGANSYLCKDKWIIGRAVHSAGKQALYISNNNIDAEFDSVPCVQYAYRDIQLPTGPNNTSLRCDITFDWLCVGADKSSLYVGFSTPANLPVEAVSGSGVMDAAIKSRLQLLTNAKDKDTWQAFAGSITAPADGRTMRLVFAWINGSTSADNRGIGACVDNLVITSGNCKRPFNLAAEIFSCDSIVVSWSGMSASYEMAYRTTGAEHWHPYRNILPDPQDATRASFSLINMSEGSYDFRVRSICTPDTSAWAYISDFVVFCPELHCVQFTDLTAPTVTCTYGTTDRSYDDPADRAHAYDNVGVVDFGSDSKQSRHTVNWDVTATDPRTGGNLPLIPKNGYASVRLGNWEWGNGAESITYEYSVDESSAVLLMQYAVVLEYPAGHEDYAMPRFVLEILDENGSQLDPTCGVRNFFAKEADGIEWMAYGSGGYYSDQVVYKPWTTVGLNLKELGVRMGSTIKVRLTTYDCFYSGHYGYAYFTLDCAKATIESVSCAKDTTAEMSLTAPEGFKYQWCNIDHTPIAGQTSRTFAPKDTATYICILTSTENSDCHFELRSASVPRLPVPTFNTKYVAANCRNRIQMENHSYIRVVQEDTIINYYNDKCDDYLWETWGTLTDGTHFLALSSDRENPIFDYPDEGGDFYVKLTAFLSGGCDESDSILIHIKPIRDYGPFERDTTLCFAAGSTQKSVWLEEQEIKTTGKYTTVYKTIAGCDSTIIWNVSLGSDTVTQLPDTALCYGDSLCVGETCIGPSSPLYRTGMWQWKGKTRASCQCDSIIMRYVTLRDKIAPVFTIDSINLATEKFYAAIQVGGTGYTSYDVTYRRGQDKREVVQHHLSTDVVTIDSINTGYCDFIFYNGFGCEYRERVLIGGSCLKLTLFEQQQCVCGKPVIRYAFTVDSGVPTRYKVDFEQRALDANLVDMAWTSLQQDNYVVDVPVPANAEPGKYNAVITFEDVVCGNKQFPVNVTLTYDSAVIFHRWNTNAIISLKNAATARKADGQPYANYDFTDFQWLHNGRVVYGEERSYMEQPGTLDMSSSYQLQLTRSDGTVLTTCAYTPGGAFPAPAHRWDGQNDIALYPSSPLAGQPISISLPEAARIELYTMLGNMIDVMDVTAGNNTIQAPQAPGIYIINVLTESEHFSLRLQVR